MLARPTSERGNKLCHAIDKVFDQSNPRFHFCWTAVGELVPKLVSGKRLYSQEGLANSKLRNKNLGYQAGSIVEEILQQLYDLSGSSSGLTFEAYVSVPDGIEEQTQRVIKENANALGVTIRVR